MQFTISGRFFKILNSTNIASDENLGSGSAIISVVAMLYKAELVCTTSPFAQLSEPVLVKQ